MRVAALATWRKITGGNDGPIYRPVGPHSNIQPDRMQADAVSTILRDHLIGAGVSLEGCSGHFLRAGVATSTIRARGADLQDTRTDWPRLGPDARPLCARCGMFDGNTAPVRV